MVKEGMPFLGKRKPWMGLSFQIETTGSFLCHENGSVRKRVTHPAAYASAMDALGVGMDNSPKTFYSI
jgi:hypothetical protein